MSFAVLFDGLVEPVEDHDHVIRRQGGSWACVRPTHAGRDCVADIHSGCGVELRLCESSAA
jgi:hypothetical protein